ncbi:MAG: hypothetical protein Q9186_002438 [Xanthomendoza sp. 1 TL-2023]
MGSQSLEALLPELQAQIMRNINSVPDLLSLLRASPRFYQVFRTRKEYIVTQVAFNHFDPQIIDDVWNLAKAMQLPRPLEGIRLHDFLEEIKMVSTEDLQPSIPLNIMAPLCKIGETIAWFVQDYHRSSLQLLTTLGNDMDLKQDPDVLHSSLSAVEQGRLQRAFCRFEVFSCLFHTPADAEEVRYSYGESYLLDGFLQDEVEEVACIRDYLVRRLCGVFADVENDALAGETSESIMKLGENTSPYDWFSRAGKNSHPRFIEYIMSRGLAFVRRILKSEGLDRAHLVIANSIERIYYLTYVLKNPDPFEPLGEKDKEYDAGRFDGEEDFRGDHLDLLSQGLLWANKNKVPEDFNREPLKGLRDWGYIFWDSRRLQASGVLDLDPEDVAAYLFNEEFWFNSESVQTLLKHPFLQKQVIAFAQRPGGRRRSSFETFCALGDGQHF